MRQEYDPKINSELQVSGFMQGLSSVAMIDSR